MHYLRASIRRRGPRRPHGSGPGPRRRAGPGHGPGGGDAGDDRADCARAPPAGRGRRARLAAPAPDRALRARFPAGALVGRVLGGSGPADGAAGDAHTSGGLAAAEADGADVRPGGARPRAGARLSRGGAANRGLRAGAGHPRAVAGAARAALRSRGLAPHVGDRRRGAAARPGAGRDGAASPRARGPRAGDGGSGAAGRHQAVVAAVSFQGMPDLLAARSQMAVSLAFHIVFAAVGIAMPVLMVVAERRHQVTGHDVYLELARRWAKGTAILFAVGAVSGTVLSFELGLLWPGFMKFAGPIIGMPFSLEGFAFFTEAIFLGVYLYGWGRISPRAHLAAGVPLPPSRAPFGVLVVLAHTPVYAPTGVHIACGAGGDDGAPPGHAV